MTETSLAPSSSIGIALNDDISLDLAVLIETRLIVQANSGGGKTFAMRRLLEQSHGTVQQVVIDIEGSLRTLRERYEYLLLGSPTDEVDFPISAENAAALALKLLETHTSAIVDLNEFSMSMRQRIVRVFLDAMIDAPRTLWHDCLLVLDEAHVFSPERDNPESKAAVEALCSRGRIRGFCAVLATQRISKLSKDALGECNNKLIGRTSLDIDMQRSNAELEFTAKSQALKKLAPGEFYVFGPAISPHVQKIRIGPVTTTHPRPGSRRSISSPPPPKSLDALLAILRALPAPPALPEEEHGEKQNRTPRARGEATSTGEQAELQSLRRLVEELRAITVSVDGRMISAAELPMLLRIGELHTRAEQATITIESVSREAPATQSSASLAGEQDVQELIRQLQTALDAEKKRSGRLDEALARKEGELQQARAALAGKAPASEPAEPALLHSEEKALKRLAEQVEGRLSRSERTLLVWLIEHDGQEVSSKHLADAVGLDVRVCWSDRTRALVRLPFIERRGMSQFWFQADWGAYARRTFQSGQQAQAFARQRLLAAALP